MPQPTSKLLALDLAFLGLPYADVGTATGSLDKAFLGLPYVVTSSSGGITGTATSGQAVTNDASGTVVAASTFQAQTASASGTVASTGTASTAQAQTAAAAGVVLGAQTAQAQTASASGTVASTGTATSAEAQTAAASGTVASTGTATSAEAQTAAATGTARSPWTISPSAMVLCEGSGVPAYSFTGNTLNMGSVAGGQSVVVMVCGYWRTDATPTITVTDNAGNTYTAATSVYVGAGTPSVNAREWMQAFYCDNVVGNSGLTLTVNIAQGSGATVFDLPSRIQIAGFGVNAQLTPDHAVFKENTSSSTTITSPTFSPSNYGAIFALEMNVLEDSVAASTVKFASPYTSLTRPGRNPASGFSDQTYGDAGYRAIGSGLTNTSVTFTGDGTVVRSIMAVNFTDAALSTITGTATSAEAQTASASGVVASTGTSSTAQAQTVDASGAVASVTYVAVTGVAATGAVGSLGSSRTRAVTGNSSSATIGSLRAQLAPPLVGTAASGAAGQLGSSRTRALTGVSGTGALGSIAARSQHQLAPLAATGAVGTVGASRAAPLTGVGGHGATGTLRPPSSLYGVSSTGTLGKLAPLVSKALTGVSATGSVGTLGKVIAHPVTGVSSAGAVGVVATSRTRAVTGVAGATFVGSVRLGRPTSGVSSVGTVGSVGQVRQVALTGVAAAGRVGSVGTPPLPNSGSVFVSTPLVNVTTSPVVAVVAIVASAVQVQVSQPTEQVLP